MPKVVSNTTPILSLLKIDKLDLLKELYDEIIVPQAVFDEIEKGKHKAFYIDLEKIEWINIQRIQDKKSLTYLIDIDKGEAETIILANEIGADLVIIDETLGRFHAEHAGLKITGTLGILLRAKASGIVKQIKPLLYEMKEKGIWLSDNLIEQVLEIAKEKP